MQFSTIFSLFFMKNKFSLNKCVAKFQDPFQIKRIIIFVINFARSFLVISCIYTYNKLTQYYYNYIALRPVSYSYNILFEGWINKIHRPQTLDQNIMRPAFVNLTRYYASPKRCAQMICNSPKREAYCGFIKMVIVLGQWTTSLIVHFTIENVYTVGNKNELEAI